MVASLNTHINGSSGTCFEGARWFKAYAKNAPLAGDHVQHTFQHGDSWSGPANMAYRDSLRGSVPMCDDLGKACAQAGDALDEFGHELDAANKLMLQARTKARAGGLEIHGPIIVPPKPLPPEPQTPHGVMTKAQADAAVSKYEKAADKYKGMVHDYNAKVRCFNECAELVKQARKKETEAHKNLNDKLPKIGGAKGIDTVSIGKTTVGKALSYVGVTSNRRRAAEKAAEEGRNNQQIFQRFADDPPPRTTRRERALYRKAAREAGVAAQEHEQTAAEYAKFLKVPRPIRNALTWYAGRGWVDALHEGSSPGAKVAAGTLKRLPFLSSTLVVGSEFWGMHKGEETFTQAATRSAGMLATASIGAEGGAAAGSFFGPPGTIIGTLAGGAVGAIGGQYIIDKIDPKDPPAEHIDTKDYDPDPMAEGRHIHVSDNDDHIYHGHR